MGKKRDKPEKLSNPGKQMDEKVWQESEFLETILESFPHPFYIIDANNYTIIKANSATQSGRATGAVTCYGLTHNSEKPCGSEEHPCPLEKVKRTKKPAKAEHIHYDKDGNIQNVEVHAFPLFDSGGNVVQVIEYCLDVTNYQQMGEALNRSEERYALAQQAANIGSWDWDIVTGELVWSEQIESMFGFGRGEFGATYEAFLECIAPEDRQYVVDSVNACIEKGKDYAIEHRIVRPDRTVHWVSETGDVIRGEDGKAIRMLGIVQDISERKKTEEEIVNLAKFPSENPYPVLRIAKDGIVLYGNAAGCELLEDWGCEVGALVPGNWRQYILRSLDFGQSEDIEAVCCKDRILSLTIAPVTEAGYVNIYGLDVTERKKAEEDLKRYREHLEKLVEARTKELMEANKQLLQKIEQSRQLEKEILNISEREQRRIGQELHDSLGQQLTGIALKSKVLEQRLTAKSLEEAVAAAEIAKLISEATGHAQSLAKGLHPVDLSAGTLRAALQQMATTNENLFGLRCTFESDKLIEVNDAEVAMHLYRIAQEAVTNAIKHGRAKNIQMTLTCDGNETMLMIKSDGLDFPKEFEARGTGMGLQIMDHRVDIIGGTLDIHKAPEGGTIVTCKFPNTK